MKIFSTLILALLISISYSQTVNYSVEVVDYYAGSGTDDGWGGDEELTWKSWGMDDDNIPWAGGVCEAKTGNAALTYTNFSNVVLIEDINSNATSITIRLEAWEDDDVTNGIGDPDRCTYNGGGGLNGDDNYINTTFTGIPFRNDPHCQWNYYTLPSVDFHIQIRIKWEYSDFSAGFDILDCSTLTPLSGQGSGSWSVYSGTNGSFADVNDPLTNFGGTLGTYQVLWSSLPGCITIYTPDTVQVDFLSTPNPNLTSSSVNICEGNPVTFNAQNGTLYDWSLNTNGNVVLSDGSGAYTLTPSLSDNKIYVSVSNGACSGLDSISFTVNSSPVPTVSENGGVLSTQTYPVYLWYFNGSAIPGATGMDYTPTQGGSYYVEVVNSNGCSGQSAPITFSGVGINELISNISIYPNPSSGIVHIQTEFPIEFATVYNSIGKKQLINLNNNDLDLSHLSNGVYIVSISINNHIITKRIILSK